MELAKLWRTDKFLRRLDVRSVLATAESATAVAAT